MSQYCEIPKDEMDGFMAAGRFQRVAVPSAAEIVYERPVSDGLSVRVFSSITDRLDGARACGEDAIRVVIWAVKNKIIVASENRVHRVAGWRLNLASRIANALRRAESGQVPMCSCGGYWVKRRGKYGEFFGCSSYPTCTNTKKVTM